MCGNIVPHGRKNENGLAYKPGRFNAIALLPQSYYQGPLTRGPSNCQPPATWCPTRAFAWTRVDRVAFCHASVPPAPPTRCVGLAGSATWPCMPRRIRAGPARHVSFARLVSIYVPRHPRALWIKQPFFAILIKA